MINKNIGENDHPFDGTVVKPLDFTQKKEVTEKRILKKKLSKGRKIYLAICTLFIVALALFIFFAGRTMVFDMINSEPEKVDERGILTIITSDEGIVKVSGNSIIYGKAQAVEEIVGTDKYDGYYPGQSLNTPYTTKKSLIIQTDSVCVVLRGKLGEKPVLSDSQKEFLKSIGIAVS